MKNWKILFFITLAALLATNIFWLYKGIDAGITHTYQQVTLDRKIKAIDILSELIVIGGQKYSKNDILHTLRQNHKEAFIVEEENLINIEGITFIFSNDQIKKVEVSN